MSITSTLSLIGIKSATSKGDPEIADAQTVHLDEKAEPKGIKRFTTRKPTTSPFYTRPFLKRRDGTDPNCATQRQTHFGQEWQFWSRHLTADEWRAGDGLHTFINYIRAELAKA